jgi:predicted transport protein
MTLYTNTNGSLEEVSEKPFKLEREIQSVFEKNLNEVMSLTLVSSEFTIKNRRIDTLAYDEATKAFIIIEYKRDKNNSVLDQGFTYLGLMLENKADFIIEYNEQLSRSLKREEVDWSQIRVVFVSPSFTDLQIGATNFKDISIELWQIKQYVNGTVSINELKKSKGAESIKPIAQQNKEFKQVVDAIQVYTEDSLLGKSSEEVEELYAKFKQAILNLSDDIDLVPNKVYLAFKKNKINIACVQPQKKQMKLWVGVKAGTLNDPKKLAKDSSTTGHNGTGDYEINIKDDSDLEYIMSLVKQAIK